MTRPTAIEEPKFTTKGDVRPRILPLSSFSRPMSKGYFFSAFILSLIVHGGLFSALFFTWRLTPVEPPLLPPPEATVEMTFETAENMPNSSAAKANTKTPKPIALSEQDKEGPAIDHPPRKAPIEEPPPPPPPPQAVPKPSGTSAPDIDKVPLPSKLQTPSMEALKTPTTSSPEQRQAQIAPPTPFPQNTEELPKKIIPSHLTQPRKAKLTEPDTHSLLATLDKFRVDQKQTHPPKARPNPQSGGARDGGGTPEGQNITKNLTAGEQQKIGASVRRCYNENTVAKNYASFVAHVVVTIDETGVVRVVDFTPQTQAHIDKDPSYRVLAEGARRALLDPNCAKLPLSEKYLGQIRRLSFQFRP